MLGRWLQEGWVLLPKQNPCITNWGGGGVGSANGWEGSGAPGGQQTISMKFVDSLIHNGNQPSGATAWPHVLLRQGVLCMKAKIMLPWDPSRTTGPLPLGQTLPAQHHSPISLPPPQV
uniref:Uncharacterized protein n=1 Tax=Chelonoidis abingdonii TaxID=106734 RepID=A0A8C0G4U3_CHEAB